MNGPLIVAILGLVFASAIANPVQPAQEFRFVGYYASETVHRPEGGRVDVEQIFAMGYSYLIYAFAGLGPDNKILVLDPENDLEENGGAGAMRRFTDLKSQNPYLRTTLAIGGYNETSDKYFEMASDPDKRRTFIDSIIPLLQQQGFDGVDFGMGLQPTPEDKENFVLLLNEMRAAFQPHDYVLSVALPGRISTLEAAYDIAGIAGAVDWINVMAYDYHGAWEPFTGHYSPLYGNPAIDLGDSLLLNANATINYFIDQGADPGYLSLGMGAFGRGFLLEDPLENGFYANTTGPLPAGPYTGQPGFWGFMEICEKTRTEPGKWTFLHDSTYKASYAYSGTQWIGYDNKASIAAKVEYIFDMGIGGFMQWSVDMDNYAGGCDDANGNYPLIQTVIEAVNAIKAK